MVDSQDPTISMDPRMASHFRALTPMSDADLSMIASLVRTRTVEKGEVLVGIGEPCRYTYMVLSGGLRNLFWDERGNEITRYIGIEGKVCAVMDAFVNGTPSKECIEAFEPGEVIEWDLATHQELTAELPAWTLAYVTVLEKAQQLNAWRLSGLLGMTATQRYAALVNAQPELVERVPDRILSTYIGISPEYFSRLKGATIAAS